MSRDYRTLDVILATDLFDGRLAKFGVHEHVAADSTGHSRLLTDDRNYLHVYIHESDISFFTAYGRNDEDNILRAIATAFETEIVSEEDCRFWGFHSDEEMNKALCG
jgi:hypothetical protein